MMAKRRSMVGIEQPCFWAISALLKPPVSTPPLGAVRFPQPAQQVLHFLGQQGGLLRRRFIARQTIEASRAAVAGRTQGRVAAMLPPRLLACVVFDADRPLCGP